MNRERYWPTVITILVMSCGLVWYCGGEEEKKEEKKTEQNEDNHSDKKSHEEKKDHGKKDKKKAGAETTDLNSDVIGFHGNWVKKKKLLKEAHGKNDRIQSEVIDVNKSIDQFYEKFKEADTLLDEFYTSVGFSQGEMDNLIKDVGKYLEKSKKRDIEALAKEGERIFDDSRYDQKEKDVDAYSIEEEFKKRKLEIEQFKLDLKAIEELDKSIGARRKKLEEELKEIQKASKEATKIAEDIWNIIDDKKAKDLVTKMDGIKTKADALKKYITVDLMKDLEGVIKKIKDQVTKVNVDVSSLEKKDIIIENRASRVALLSKEKAEKFKEDVVASDEMEERRESKEKIRQELEKAKNLSVLGVVRHSVYMAMVSTNDYLSKLWTSMMNYFMGTATVVSKKKKATAVDVSDDEIHRQHADKEDN